MNSCCAITNHGTRHIPLHGWRTASTGEQPEAYFDRDEYRNYRRNPITFFDQDRNTEVRQPSDSYFDRNGGREIRNTDDFPKPQVPWEEALRHSVYLTLVRDKIDSLLIKHAGSDRQNLKVNEHTKDEGEIADVNLWRNIQKAQFKQNSKEKGPVFGDIAILSRGKLIESLQGFEFVEDEDIKECIECHLFTARHNEVEAERILTSRCDSSDCSNQRIKALWTVRRIRHRNPEGDDPPFMYELMFSIASPKPDKTNLDYNEPSQTFSIQEADKLPKLPRKHERKGKFIFQDEKTQDYNKGYHSPQGTTVVQSYGDVRTEGPPWYDGFKAGRHQQQSTEHPPYVNRYPEFYPDYQESSTRLNTGEKYPTRDEEFRHKNPPYVESSFQPTDNAKYRGHIINVNVNSEESTAPENVRSHKALKDFKIPIITHLHHHYYLNDKGVPVMKASKFENYNNFEVYLPNGFNKGTTASIQNTPYSEDEEYSNDQHSGKDEPVISDTNTKKDNSNKNTSPQVNENRVTIPFHTTNSMSLQTETMEEEEATTISSIGKVTLSESQFYRKPVKFVESTQHHEVKNRPRKLRPTKPFRPSPVDERKMFSELDPLYMPTSSTPTAFTSEAQVINLKNPYVEVNNFSQEKPIYEENQEDYLDDNPSGPGHVIFEDNKEGTGEIPDSSYENPSAEGHASSNEHHEETSKDDSNQNPETVNVNSEGSPDDTSEESFNNQSESIQTPLETSEEEKYTEPVVTEKIILLSEVGTTIENIYLPEFSDSNENGDHNNHNMSPSGERTTMYVQATQPSYTTQNQDANEHTSTTRKINDHRIQRKPYKPNRRVKLQKKFSELIKSQLPSPRSGGTTLPYGSAVTPVYEEKMDTVPEFQNNSMHSPSLVSPFRKLRQRTTPSVSTTETTAASTVTEVYVERNLETEPQSYNSTSAPLNIPYRKIRQRQSHFKPTAGTSPAASSITEVYEIKSVTESQINTTSLPENFPATQLHNTYTPSTGSSKFYAVSSVADAYDEKKYSEKMETDSESQDNSTQTPLANSIQKLRQNHRTLLPTTGISAPYAFTLVTEKYEENINSDNTHTISEPQDNSTQTPLGNTSTSVRKLNHRHSTLPQTTGISTPYASPSITEKYEENNHSEKIDTVSESQGNNSTQTPLGNTPISIKKIRQRYSNSLLTTDGSTPYAFSSATEKYEEKNHKEIMDTVSETGNNSTFAPISPIRRLRQRNTTFIPPRISTSTFIPQRITNNGTFNLQTNSRQKYQRKLGTWTTSHLRPKLLTEKPVTFATEVTTEASTEFTDEGSKMTTVYDDVMKTVMDQNTTIYYKEIDKHNETTPNKTDEENDNRYSDSEVNASEHSSEITELPGNLENDSTKVNESTELTTISEITSISEEEESLPSTVSTETIATVQTTETSSKPYIKSDEEIFTPLTKKSFVTSISLKLGNRTRPYYQRSTEHPRKGGLRFIDQLKLTENTTFMADLLSRFNMDDTMKAKISEVNHAGKEIRIHKADETSDRIKIHGGVAKVDNKTRQIIQHGKFIK